MWGLANALPGYAAPQQHHPQSDNRGLSSRPSRPTGEDVCQDELEIEKQANEVGLTHFRKGGLKNQVPDCFTAQCNLPLNGI